MTDCAGIRPTGPAWDAAAAETNWLVYRLLPRNDGSGKLDKVPVRNGRNASPEAAARLTFAEAFAEAAGPNDRGIGYLPREGSALIGIDLDGALIRGNVGIWCADWLDLTDTWTEVSPSGCGLRVIASRESSDGPAVMHERRGVGYYGSASRFFTFTGALLPGRSTRICSAPAMVREVLAYLDGSAVRVEREDPDDDTGAPHWFDRLPGRRQDEEVERMLGHLTDPAFGLDYQTWLTLSFAVYRATDSTGYEIWNNWCRQLPNYCASQNLKKWQGGLDEPLRGQRVTVGTLIAIARQRGYQPPKDALDHRARQLARRLARANFHSALAGRRSA